MPNTRAYHDTRGVGVIAYTKKSMKRNNWEKMQRKEYSDSYLKEKIERNELPNTYPKTRIIQFKRFFLSRDLYTALAFFFAAQLAIVTIAAGQKYENYAGALNLVGILVGIITLVFGIRLINRRQRKDPTRRRFRPARVLATFMTMMVSLLVVTFIYRQLGIAFAIQPNQASLDSLMDVFPVAMLFVMVIVSPVVEEIVFRELLPFATGPSYLSFGISSLIFVALHAPFGLIGWTSYGILSAGFLYARLKDNNVYTAIAVHILWNASTVILGLL